MPVRIWVNERLSWLLGKQLLLSSAAKIVVLALENVATFWVLLWLLLSGRIVLLPFIVLVARNLRCIDNLAPIEAPIITSITCLTLPAI